MLLTYGYEIFNFNLSLDEPVFVGAGQRSMAGLFAEQGRWGMALQYLVLPETIIPTVAAGLAVLLIAGSLWMFATRTLGLSPLAAGLVTSVAATLPTIGFAVSFATIAVGVGLGFAAVALFAIFATSWAPRRLLVALGLGTLALGIYQAFAFALLAVAIALTARAPDWRTARKHAAILVGCLGANAITSAVAKVALGAGTNAYVSDLMDLGGLARDPVARIAGAVEQNWAVLAPGASLFDKLQPWLALGVIVLVVLAARTSLRCPPGTSRLITVACVVALVAIPLAAALIVTELPVRSMVYLPFCLIALTAIAAGGPSDQDKSSTAPHVAGIVWAGVGVCILAVIANASVTNRAYVAADAALTQDRFLAMRINEELGRLFPNETDPVRYRHQRTECEGAQAPSEWRPSSSA